ncbi:putative light chain 3 [Monocercomonoides exilis]|uniref:putative light chain 3 n=1 Tax=Monocercomonoides exilis TaxID=2049356 RepID=UPI00355A93D9|nr:putative light chain 3 [Monocercomonoides exilis]
MPRESGYKATVPFETRKHEIDKIRKKYPDRVPILCERHSRAKIPEMSQKKFLVQENITIGEFLRIIRRNISLDQEKSLFVFIDNRIPNTGDPLSVIYSEYMKKHQGDDGYLYMLYTDEATFGTA